MNLRWLLVLLLTTINLGLGGAQAAPPTPASMAAPRAAPAPAPIVRTQLTPSQARVGETVTLELAILVPGWLTAPIDLPVSLDIPGVLARLDDGAATNVNETINGIAYAGLRRRYQLVAQSAGRFEVPPVRFSVTFADGTRRVDQPLSSAPVGFEATLPTGLDGLGYMIVSSDFRVQQSLDRKLTQLQVGDALVRTISQRAIGISATQLPVLRFAATPGIATYPDAAQFSETIGERGADSFATQTQRVTYVLERAGTYQLPALELRWLDTRSGTVRTARVPALPFTVADAPRGAASTDPNVVGDIPSSRNPNSVKPASSNSLKPAARIRSFAERFWPWLAGLLLLLLARGEKTRV